MATTNSTDRAIFEALPREATLASRVVNQMETMIAQGGLADGSRLPPERELAAQFGVSRTVIREAVAALAALGLLEVQAGSGTVVRRPRVESLARLVSLSLSIGGSGEPSADQLRETARILAGEAASEAAERRTEEDLEAIARAVREAELDTRRADSAARVLRAVAKAAHNEVAAVLLDIVLALGGAPRHNVAGLRPVLDQIRKTDSKASRRAVRDLFDEPATAAALSAGAPKKSRKPSTV